MYFSRAICELLKTAGEQQVEKNGHAANEAWPFVPPAGY
jgi:hypothetical protein